MKPDWDLCGAAEDCKLLVELGYRGGPGGPISRVEARERVPRQTRGHAQGDQAMKTTAADRRVSATGDSEAAIPARAVRFGPGSWPPLASSPRWLDFRYGWITPAFDAIAHQFYEVPLLARIRRPSQLVLVRWHLAIGSVLARAGLHARLG